MTETDLCHVSNVEIVTLPKTYFGTTQEKDFLII